ncbi:hypothetical protein M1L60_23940 [Actinoplanes sp. TRM 88003]|uniref:Uncharacterized protein n=1 Tax=Paractinoplanes aksuensis TaxID=2939490 RepID=A0ABT1DUD8_9ACTN|nr:hypothetical protein [Actinoplanes aksuensis]MCO8273651.1 hypothetical protein [Actinoplanes aksuensis]
MIAPFSRPGTPEYVEATTSFQLAATVDPATICGCDHLGCTDCPALAS